MYELKKLERYLRVNLLGPGPRLIEKEFTGPRSQKDWETVHNTVRDFLLRVINMYIKIQYTKMRYKEATNTYFHLSLYAEEAMGWTIQGSIPGPDKIIFPLIKMSWFTLEPIQPPIDRHRGSFPGVKRSGREFDHSTPSRAKLKNEINCLSLLHRAFDSNSLFISPTYALVNRSILMLTH